jgi:hypothetical protein
MALEDRKVKRGDTGTFSIEVTDDDEAVVDLTGWTFWFTARKTPAPTATITDLDSLISKEITNASTSGIVVVPITPEDTDITPGTYFYDVQYKDSAGTVVSTDTYKFIIEEDITRSR